ncbi:MAG: hypothetical protein ACRDT8_06985 [Micromonosporaceae bacterium]
MAKTVKVEYWAIYNYKQVVKDCMETTGYIRQKLKNLDLDKAAFGHVKNSREMQTAWNDASDARQNEIKALQDLLEDVNTALEDVLELYGYTDAEMSNRVRDAERNR